MTSPARPYREGLDLPEAFIIRSEPGSSRRLRPKESTHESDSVGYPSRGRPPPKWDTYEAWKEWNVNSVKHGPPQSVNPPTFVPSRAEYDELGRSALQGVDVDVSEGKARRHVENGDVVADWYRTLSTRTSRATTPSEALPPRLDDSSARPLAKANITAATADHAPESAEIKPNDMERLSLETTRSSETATVPPNQPPILKVHRREWFIRRALLTASQRTPQFAEAPPPNPSSISNLLTIPSQSRVVQAQYVLGPENRGYAILKDRLGWEGGGLGRSADWIPPQPVSTESIAGTSRSPRSPVTDTREVVDLTGDSAEEEEEDLDIPAEGGPGRTAPIATKLKLDRLGLGHRRAAPREHLESTKKKVTHTASEILEAQKRSRYKHVTGITLGKKGKIKWKEREKREREERRRLAAALNA